jgi:hypothetical protein
MYSMSLILPGLASAGVEPERQEAGLLSGDIVEDRYGYLNRMESSRRELQRNIELIWLISLLLPGFKTVADFRKGQPHPGAGWAKEAGRARR